MIILTPLPSYTSSFFFLTVLCVTFADGSILKFKIMYSFRTNLITYGHRLKNNRHPVRSAKDKFQIGQLVVGWVTTSEY